MTERKVAVVTGGARRIGSVIAQNLHQDGMNIVVHYRKSRKDADELVALLNATRPNSAVALPLDMSKIAEIPGFVDAIMQVWGRVDVLINNASSFYPTPFGSVTETQWQDLMSSNLMAPFFITQALAPALRVSHGAVVNIVDIKVDRPSSKYSVYCIAKAGLWMMTKSLAKELAPSIRVNAIAPGAMIRPENDYLSPEELAALQKRIPLKRIGEAEDIAKAVKFLVCDAHYTTGHMLTVDGGRSLLTDGDRTP